MKRDYLTDYKETQHRLCRLIVNGLADSHEADALRAQLDDLWYEIEPERRIGLLNRPTKRQLDC